MNRIRILLFGTFFSFLTLAQAQNLEYQALVLPDTLTRHADAIVRQESMVVHIRNPFRMEIEMERAVTVLNGKGDAHALAMVSYNKSRKVGYISAAAYDALGRETQKYKQRDFRDLSAVDGGTLYSDARRLYLDYTPVSYPYTLVVRYTLEDANTAPLPNWYFLSGYRVSTQESRFELRYDSPELRPDFQESHLEGYAIEKESFHNGFRYVGRNLPAIRDESLSPPFTEVAPSVMLRPRRFGYEGIDGEVDTWQDIGKWMHQHMLDGRDALPEATKQKVRTLVQDTRDTLERARRVYRFVQENTRYISVQVGIGGIRPISAIEVDRVKYGDCKGLSNYTKALLDAVGVTAYYVHVEAGQVKSDFKPDFADLAQGNHVILAIPYQGQLHWIDCTSQTIPFGFLGDFTDDRLVHVIDPEGGYLVRTPQYKDEANGQVTEARVRLDAEGTLAGSVEVRTSGIQYDSHYAIQDLKPDDQVAIYRRRWGYLENLQLEDLRFKNDTDSVRFTETLTLKATNYWKKAGNRILLTANAFNRLRYVPDRYRDRTLPFQVLRGYQDREHYQIELPEGYKPEAIPGPVAIESPFGSYRMEVQYLPEEHILEYKREALVREGRYDAEQYEAYRDFHRQVARAESAQAVLIQTQESK
ncbi:DUF3857 domain-containing transglutaminase family protein [Robiginitalea sediminis]|uniref:DUF3857 domain-containing transglutaminase family protein n=1 Tax=Robiginitalea sediminis TaxID=1982593 RepID=UPI000B4BB0C6|nr:DUF3857 domain-containing protein [Robiginitalea sediminis]